MKPYIVAYHHVGLLDSAAIHLTTEARGELESTFFGFWELCAKYSPELKPVELGFSLAKRRLRSHEREVIDDPISWINEAFHYYSTTGPGGHKAFNIWNFYRINHSVWVDNY